MKIKDWPEADRPREKLSAGGVYGMTDAELLAILIGQGVKNMTALDIARTLLSRCGNLKKIREKTVKELRILNIPGLGIARIVSILAACELGARALSRRGEKTVCFSRPQDIFDYYFPLIGGLKYELFKVAAVDGQNRLLGETTVSKGILDTSVTHPREVFKFALAENASSLFLIHNHPSGVKKPSPDDLQVTERLRNAGELMGTRILDHVIITDAGYFSFSENSLL